LTIIETALLPGTHRCARASYGAAKYERLALIKAEYDPENVIHLNQNIKPALHPA
jgi:hypothetical protein